MTATEPTTTPTDRSATPMAALVTLVLLVGMIAILVVFAFSGHNAPASVDGTTATTSHWIE